MKRRHIPEASRRRKIRHRYGLEPEDYEKMFLEQCGACAVCQEIKIYPLYVDHNHETGKVRGLLCAKCNTIAGSVEDKHYEKVLCYLEKHNDNRT